MGYCRKGIRKELTQQRLLEFAEKSAIFQSKWKEEAEEGGGSKTGESSLPQGLFFVCLFVAIGVEK